MRSSNRTPIGSDTPPRICLELMPSPQRTKATPTRVRTAEREASALELRKAGASFESIALSVGQNARRRAGERGVHLVSFTQAKGRRPTLPALIKSVTMTWECESGQAQS